MEIRPILSAMTRNKTGAILIALQIAFTLAIVVNAVFIINERIRKITRSTGMDVENIIAMDARAIGEDYNKLEMVRADMEILRNLPGVVSASTSQHVPLSGGGWGTELKAQPGEDAPRFNMARYNIDDRIVDTLGLKLESGRAFHPEEIMYYEDFGHPIEQVLITRVLADEMFPDGGALGATVYNGLDEPGTVVGVIERMHGAWVGWDKLENVVLVPLIPSGAFTRYIVRTEPGERDRLIPVIEETLARSSKDRIIQNIKPMSDLKKRSYSRDTGMAILLSAVIVLLVAITALGIVGLASFLVRQRTKQIGTRRAIGARKFHIVRYFMMENWLMTTFGVVLGTVLAFALNHWLVTQFEMTRLSLVYVPVGILSLWALGLIAVFGPARRAASISPSIATRTV